jgi:predicted secreted acid phosphatase
MFKNIIQILFFPLIFLMLVNVAIAKEPMNAYDYQKALNNYYDSGEYFADIAAQLKQAQSYLDKRVAENNQLPTDQQKKLAVVLDIDETSLSGYPCMRTVSQHVLESVADKSYKQYAWAKDFAGRHFTDVMAACKGFPAIPGMVDFYNHAKSNQIAVFFLTGRHDDYKDLTIHDLQHAGYKNWNGLLLWNKPYSKYPNADQFKLTRRKELQQTGYTIIIDIGDQYSDLYGGEYEKGFKLPNPFYFIP